MKFTLNTPRPEGTGVNYEAYYCSKHDMSLNYPTFDLEDLGMFNYYYMRYKIEQDENRLTKESLMGSGKTEMIQILLNDFSLSWANKGVFVCIVDAKLTLIKTLLACPPTYDLTVFFGVNREKFLGEINDYYDFQSATFEYVTFEILEFDYISPIDVEETKGYFSILDHLS